MTTDPGIKRLRWVMLLVMIFDLAMTLAGQPASYWHKPATAQEGNPVVRLIMHQGIVPLLLVSIVYATAIVAFVSLLPRRAALVVLLAFTLLHCYCGSHWLRFHFDYTYSSFLPTIVLAVLLVVAGLDTKQTPARTGQRHPKPDEHV